MEELTCFYFFSATELNQMKVLLFGRWGSWLQGGKNSFWTSALGGWWSSAERRLSGTNKDEQWMKTIPEASSVSFTERETRCLQSCSHYLLNLRAASWDAEWRERLGIKMDVCFHLSGPGGGLLFGVDLIFSSELMPGSMSSRFCPPALCPGLDFPGSRRRERRPRLRFNCCESFVSRAESWPGFMGLWLGQTSGTKLWRRVSLCVGASLMQQIILVSKLINLCIKDYLEPLSCIFQFKSSSEAI